MDPGTLIALIVGVVGVAITIIIWIASTRAVRFQEAQASPAAYLRSVDEDAYERARKIYEGAIDQLESEVIRLNSQIRDFQEEIRHLNSEIIGLRGRTRKDFDDSGPQPTIS